MVDQEIPPELEQVNNATVESSSEISLESGPTDESKTALRDKTKLLRDTLELLLDKSEKQKRICEQLTHENRYLQDYVENLMSQGNVLDK
ncbi:LANO_0C06128g1_1 [Lachancea nothofagi CBS 11611]|uniref:LANO_0C06128g1_1 n=1 Tax=Lachancea nothofagi CBS 11611 TaxID=1266666 RepID=A0A1G4J7T2_9SACH|nr:LANO_0C06128g1_1 [Lachancea nothofagi CBS 11611]